MTFTPDVISLSPNHSPGQPSGKKVVVHATRSGISMNPREFEATLNWFGRESSQVSAHGLVGRDGRIARIVPDSQTAWHAGIHNPDMWGWELEQGVESDGFTIKQMESWAIVARYYVEKFGVAAQHITDISKSGFIGHQETPQGISVGKSDPGAGFMWQAFISLLEDDMDWDTFKEMSERFWREGRVPALDGHDNELGVNSPGRWDGVGLETRRALGAHDKDGDKHSAGEAHTHEIPAGRTEES